VDTNLIIIFNILFLILVFDEILVLF